jgi:hypothetical protein
MNRECVARVYLFRASGAIPVDLVTRNDGDRVEVPAGEQLSLPVQLLAIPGEDERGNSRVEFTVETLDAPRYSVTQESRFVAPERSSSGTRP